MPTPQTDPERPEESVPEEIQILPPEPFCDAEATSAAEEASRESQVQSGTSGQSLVASLRLAAALMERESEARPSRTSETQSEVRNSTRTIQKLKISATPGGEAPDSTLLSNVPQEDQENLDVCDEAPGAVSTDPVPLLLEVDLGEIGVEECSEPAEVKANVQMNRSTHMVRSEVEEEKVEEELEFEEGQEELGTVWVAELYMNHG